MKTPLNLNEINESVHDKTNKMTCAPSEDSDQPGQPPSLTRVFAVAKDPMLLHADSEDSDQTGRVPRLIRVFAGRTYHFAGAPIILLVLSCCGSKNMLTHSNNEEIKEIVSSIDIS